MKQGTQFDLGGFFAEERGGVARLDDFPSALTSVHQKLAQVIMAW
jgi:hypothetical protein